MQLNPARSFSGQKVVLNGGLNLSVLDGWWAEAYDGANGFAVGAGRTHTSVDVHDRMVMDYVLKCYLPAAAGTSSDMSRA